MESVLLGIAAMDPNIVYIALLAGLWVGVTSAYIPGTGIVEISAGLLLVGSIIILSMMPTNWLAVMLIAVGISSYLILPLFWSKFGYLADVGLLLQAIGSLFLFDGLVVSPLIIGGIVLVGFAYNRIVLLPLLRQQRHANEYDASNQVVGVIGRVVKPLDPVGTVNVQGEHWTARSDEPLEVGTPVIVRDQHGLELSVEKAKREDRLEPFANGHNSFSEN